ncbi:MAG: hypothetical protein ACP5XB_11650 [Isosphaeraceae bacterium]
MRTVLLDRLIAVCLGALALTVVFALPDLLAPAMGCPVTCSGNVSNSCLLAVPNPCGGMYQGCFSFNDPCGVHWQYAEAKSLLSPWYICQASGNGSATCSSSVTICATIQQYTNNNGTCGQPEGTPVNVQACSAFTNPSNTICQ